MPLSSEIRVLPTQSDLFRAAAAEFADCSARAVSERGRFTVALSGGSTPRGMFALLASGAIPNVPWDKIYFFWGDERHVPPDNSESNYRMANEAMLSKVPVPVENVFRIPAEGKDANVVADTYEQTVRGFFALKPGEFPRFDLILLGMGPDGHTASLFPGTAALQETKRIFVANWVEKMGDFRFTLTYPAINHAAEIAFLISGPDKAATLQQVLENKSAHLPSQRIQANNGKLLWFVDQAAARNLKIADSKGRFTAE
ncbi:MAG: 6-phosphogluconolactonase [Terriglobales bacterium]|jgi:6-phosphogluconolactonase